MSLDPGTDEETLVPVEVSGSLHADYYTRNTYLESHKYPAGWLHNSDCRLFDNRLGRLGPTVPSDLGRPVAPDTWSSLGSVAFCSLQEKLTEQNCFLVSQLGNWW